MSSSYIEKVHKAWQSYMRNASIAHKLLIIVMAPSLTALFLACGMLFFFTATILRQGLESEISSIARMNAKQMGAAYQVVQGANGQWMGQWFPRGASTTLTFLEDTPVIAAALYDEEGVRIATFFQDRQPVELPSSVPGFTGSRLRISAFEYSHPIEAVQNPDYPGLVTVGTLYLLADASSVWKRFVLLLFAVLLIIALSTIAVYLLSQKLRSTISQPITHLSLLTQTISEERNYTLRAVKTSEDEIGELVDGFNAMLDRIQAHRQTLQEAYDKLEDRVQERTAELQQETLKHKETASDLKREIKVRKAAEKDLKRAKVAAEAASMAKGSFVAHVSHEIRTPMNGILGMTELLRGTTLTAPQRRYLETIHRSATALLDIVGDVLDYSKIEAGQIELNEVPFNIHTICENVVELLSSRAQEKGIGLFLRYAPHTPRRLIGDPTRITQILTNLAANALKFTDSGHVFIDVSGKIDDDGNVTLRIYVEDTGIGASRDKIHQIFGEYVQADASVEQRYGGTGLGLAIAKHLVELMGGKIGVQSREGVGSRFIFELKLPRDKRPDTVLSNNSLDGISVSVLDINEVRGNATCQNLAEWGMQAEHYRKLDAIPCNTSGNFEIILVEDQGLEPHAVGCAQVLRTRNNAASLVALASCAEQGEAEELHRVGYAGYLSRPFRESELRLVLERVVKKSTGGTLVTRYDNDTPIGQVSEVEMFHSNATVLVVDDSEVNREVAKEMLLGFGCEVIEEDDGIGAVKRVEAGEALDLILMDCQMTRLDGYEATQQIREMEQDAAHIPIIAVTAMAVMGDKQRCIDAGMDDYLLKPFNPEKLVSYLKRWLPKDKRSYREKPVSSFSEPEVNPAAIVEPENKVFDRDKALWVTGGNVELFYKACRVFMKHMPERFDTLREAVKIRNDEDVSRLAHSIKGASASIGGEALRTEAFGLENAGREGSQSEYDERFAKMEICYKALEEILLSQLPTD